MRAITRCVCFCFVALVLGAASSASAAPAVLFTDVESGPKSGGPGNLGVPISIFGTGFGASRGTSRVTIGGVEVASYLVWGAKNAQHTALDMLVVQPGAAVTGGPIVVTVGGQASNADAAFMPNAGKVFYIAPSGSDANACVATAPCATIAHVAANVMRPGDTVLLRGGSYAESEIWIRAASAGTLSQRKTIKRYPGEQVYLTNAARGFLVDADYITVSGLNFQNGKSLGAVAWANRHQRGNKFIDNTFVGTISWDAIGTHGHDHVIAGNVCDVSGSSVGTQGHCYYISDGTNLKLLYNVGRGAPGYGIHLFDQRRSTSDFQRIIRDVLVEGNLLERSPLRSGMIVAMADEGGLGNVIEHVVIRNNRFAANNHAGLVLQGISRNILVERNTFAQNGRQGIHLENTASLRQVEIRHNVIDQSPNPYCTSNCDWFAPAHIQSGPAVVDVTIHDNSYQPPPPIILHGTDSGPVVDTTLPVFSNVGVTGLTATGATVNWTTNEPADSQVEYGLTASYGKTTTLAPALTTAHSQVLSGLTSNTLHHYRVRSRDAAGNLALSNDRTFTTAAGSATGCRTSSTSWQSIGFPTQVGRFTAHFTVVPRVANMEGVVGLSALVPGRYTSLAAILALSPSGRFEARHGGVYAANTTIGYSAGLQYRVRMVVDVPAKTYSVYIAPPGKAEQALAVNYKFRTEQATVTKLSRLGFIAAQGSHDVCGVSVSP